MVCIKAIVYGGDFCEDSGKNVMTIAIPTVPPATEGTFKLVVD